jgi:hypothetical protein
MKKSNYNEIIRKRYKILRDAGYSVAEARKLRKTGIDVTNIKTKKVGKKEVLVKNKDYYKVVKPIREKNTPWIKKHPKKRKIIIVDSFPEPTTEVLYEDWKYDVRDAKKDNTTTLSTWGYIARTKIPDDDIRGWFYKNRTLQMAKEIQQDMNLESESQAYYVIWYAYKYGLSYEQAKKDLKVDPNFEIYIKSKLKKEREK